MNTLEMKFGLILQKLQKKKSIPLILIQTMTY